jgi:LytS/YehU family sensor histidine kinase
MARAVTCQTQGVFKIVFSKTALGFDIEVIDNGVGIHSDDSVSGNKKRRPSLGLDNVRKRISLFKSMKFGTAKLFIEDLKDTSTDSSGTRVILHFEK